MNSYKKEAALSTAIDVAAIVEGGDNVVYNWDFGDGSTGIGITTTHIYSEPGRYEVQITAVNRTGGMTATTPVEVQPLPPSMNRFKD